MKIIKIIAGVLLILGALGNLTNPPELRGGQVTGYLGVTAFFFIIGAFLLYSGAKSDSSNIRITADDE